jgi:hypothetical protein
VIAPVPVSDFCRLAPDGLCQHRKVLDLWSVYLSEDEGEREAKDSCGQKHPERIGPPTQQDYENDYGHGCSDEAVYA